MIDLADLFGAVLSQRNRFVAWLRDRFFLSIRNIPKVRDYVLQMKFKPMPRFTEGIVRNSGVAERDELVGRMFIQPQVEFRCGFAQRAGRRGGPALRAHQLAQRPAGRGTRQPAREPRAPGLRPLRGPALALRRPRVRRAPRSMPSPAP